MNDDLSQQQSRLDAAGALAHDMRTPLTAITMALDIARSVRPEGELAVDAELEAMMRGSVAALDRLLTDFHEFSRMERSMVAFSIEKTNLHPLVEAAADGADCEITVDWDSLAGVDGEWDSGRLTRALSYLVDSTNKLGDGRGIVSLAVKADQKQTVFCLQSGDLDGDERGYGSDAGYSYFHASLVIDAMGGNVTTERTTSGARLTVSLPRP